MLVPVEILPRFKGRHSLLVFARCADAKSFFSEKHYIPVAVQQVNALGKFFSTARYYSTIYDRSTAIPGNYYVYIVNPYQIYIYCITPIRLGRP